MLFRSEEEGPIFSKFRLTWENSGDMQTWDTLSFYREYEMYKFQRTFWWADHRNETNGNDWTIMNTNYLGSGDSGVSQWVVDGSTFSIQTSNFNSNEYIIAYDSNANNHFLAQGLFLVNFMKGNEFIVLNDINMTGIHMGGQPRIIPGYQTDLDNKGPHASYIGKQDYNITVELWELCKKYAGLGVGNSITQEMNGYNSILRNPLTWSNKSVEPLFFNLNVQLYDTDGLGAPGVNVTLYNTTAGWSGVRYEQGNFGNLQSNSTGGIVFSGLKGADYYCVVSYKAYNMPTVNLTTFNITIDTTKNYTVENLNLTTISLKFVKLGQIETPIVGANVSLIWNQTGSEPMGILIGSSVSDGLGNVNFYYLNSSESEGNYTIMVNLYDNYKPINYTIEEIGRASCRERV